jgi:hypothetical protein
MSSKRIEIFKNASNSLKISLKYHAFSKKSLVAEPHKGVPNGICRFDLKSVKEPKIRMGVECFLQ